MYELYFITDRRLSKLSLEEQVAAAVRGGADIVQYREKELGKEEMIKEAKKLKEICDRGEIEFIVNDDVDVALACGAEGVHIGQGDAPYREARKKLGKGKIIGVSASTVAEAVRAQEEGADYIGLGPIFPTRTKPDAARPGGLGLIRETRERVIIPIVAIGGITKGNVEDVIVEGADGVAAISELLKERDLEGAVAEMRELILLAKKRR